MTDLPRLARGLAASATGVAPSYDARDDLAAACAAARSFRVALPLGTAAGCTEVLISQDLRRLGGVATFWATPAERSLVGQCLRARRTAAVEGAGALRLADARQLGEQEGATAFLCVPIVLESSLVTPRPAVAALLLSYATPSDPPQDELRSALLLAAELSRRHSKELAAHTARLGAALHPTQHSAWGPGIDEEYPELSPLPSDDDEEDSEDEWLPEGSSDSPRSEDDDGSPLGPGGSAAADPSGDPSGSSRLALAVAAASRTAVSWAMISHTLRFADRKLERRFQQWRNGQLSKIDATALLSLLVYHGAASFLLPFTACRPGWLGPVSVLPALTVLSPLLLLLLDRSHRWYSRHRDQLLMCTYVLLACHNALDLSAQLSAVPPGAWRSLLRRLEAAWFVGLSLILQVQFTGQCLMLAGGVALRALLHPACAARLAGSPAAVAVAALGDPDDECLMGGTIRFLVLRLVLPCCLAYYTELSARRAFCRSAMRSSPGPGVGRSAQ